MRMIQLPNYLQEDVSLQADLWLFLGRSSRPPLLLSPPLEIIRGCIIFFWGGGFLLYKYLLSLLALQGGTRAGVWGVPAVNPSLVRRRCPRGCVCRGGDPDPVGLSGPQGGPEPLGRQRAAAAIFSAVVFLAVNTSSLHPQDGFQASILFPMATQSRPANLNPRR